MKNKKGFTLVELLAVIVILAVILAVAVPVVLGVINKSREDALNSTAGMLAAGVKNQYMIAQIEGESFPTGTSGSPVSPCPQTAAQYSTSDITCTYWIDTDSGLVTVNATSVSGGKYWTGSAVTKTVTR